METVIVPAIVTATATAAAAVTRFGILGTSKIAADFVNALAAHQLRRQQKQQQERTAQANSGVCEDGGGIADVDIADLRTVAVGSRGLQRAAEFGKSVGIDRVYGSYEELVNDPSVDVVYVATSTIDHYEHALLALRAGKDVLCEKAFTVNARQCRHLIEVAKSSKCFNDESRSCFLMEANWMVYWPLVQQAVGLIKEGKLGHIRMIQADLGFNCPFNQIYDPKYGGGSLLAVGMYCVTLANLACDCAPDAIVSQCSFGDDITPSADKTCSALLHYPTGTSAVITGTVEANVPSVAVITGTLGSIKLTSPMFVCPTKMDVVWFDGQASETVEMPAPTSSTGTDYHFPNSSGLVYEALHVHYCRRTGRTESELWNLAHSLELMEVLDSIRTQCGIRYPCDL
jgi:predicted dehydrogenase